MTTNTSRGWLVLGSSLAVLVAVCVAQLTSGDMVTGDVWEWVSGASTSQTAVITGIRLPRIMAGLVAGAGFGVAGTLLQGAMRNPLAEPATLGINAGAYLAVILTTLFVPFTPMFTGATAFVGAITAAALVVAIGSTFGFSPARLALAGMAIHMALTAITGVLLLLRSQEITGLLMWGSGNIGQTDFARVTAMGPWVVLVCVGAAIWGRSLDVAALGDATASAVGVDPKRTRLLTVLAAVVLVAAAVTVAGPIGFVGLMAPHLIRRLSLISHRWLVPLSAITGAVVVIGADIVVRLTDTAAYATIPVGVATTVVGAPVMIWVARTMGEGAQAAAQPGLDGEMPPGRTTVLLGMAAMVVVVLGPTLGDTIAPVGDVVAAILGGEGGAVSDFRLPRLIVALVAGGLLAASGVLIQGATRNPLAAPGLVGIGAGAGIGALVGVEVFGLSLTTVPMLAFVGAMLAWFAVVVFAGGRTLDPDRMLLVGVAVAAFGYGVISYLVIAMEMGRAQVLAWLAGTVYAAGWGDLIRLLPWVMVIVAGAVFLSRGLDVLGLGDGTAAGVGLGVDRTRMFAFGLGAMAAAAAISVVGVLGFVGLLAPHTARALIGAKHRWLLPVAVLIGAVVVGVADSLGRFIVAPIQIPAGSFTALIGCPYFLYLLWCTRAGARVRDRVAHRARRREEREHVAV